MHLGWPWFPRGCLKVWPHSLLPLLWCHVFSHIGHSIPGFCSSPAPCPWSGAAPQPGHQTQNKNHFFCIPWQFGTMFNDLLLSLCVAKTWGLLPDPGVQNSSCTTSSLLQSLGEGKQLSHSHKVKTLLVFESTSPIFTGFSLKCPLRLLHTFHFTRILFSNLVRVCALLPDSPGLEIVQFFPRGTRRLSLWNLPEAWQQKSSFVISHSGNEQGKEGSSLPLCCKGGKGIFLSSVQTRQVFVFFFLLLLHCWARNLWIHFCLQSLDRYFQIFSLGFGSVLEHWMHFIKITCSATRQRMWDISSHFHSLSLE